MTPPCETPLAMALSAAVPLRIAEFKGMGGVTERNLWWARTFAQELGADGDALLYKGEKQGRSAGMFSGLARAIAILSFCPGGIRFLGEHWESFA